MPHYDPRTWPWWSWLEAGKVLPIILGKEIVAELVHCTKGTQLIITLQYELCSRGLLIVISLKKETNKQQQKTQAKCKWILSGFVSMSFGPWHHSHGWSIVRCHRSTHLSQGDSLLGRLLAQGGTLAPPGKHWRQKVRWVSGLWHSLKSTSWVTTVSFKSRHQVFGTGSYGPGHPLIFLLLASGGNSS